MATYTRPIFSWAGNDLDGQTFNLDLNGTDEQLTMSGASLLGFSVNGSSVAAATSVLGAFCTAILTHSLMTAAGGSPLCAATYTIDSTTNRLKAQISITMGNYVLFSSGSINFSGTLSKLAIGFSTTNPSLTDAGVNATIDLEINHQGYWSPPVHQYDNEPVITRLSQGSHAPTDITVFDRIDYGSANGRVVTVDYVDAANIYDEYAGKSSYASTASRDVLDVNNTLENMLVDGVGAANALTMWEGDADSRAVLLNNPGQLTVGGFATQMSKGVKRYRVSLPLRE